MMLRCTVCAMMAAGLAMANGAAVAQKYPEKAVRIVVPFTPGGGADILARLVAQKLTDDWGRNVVVENRAGGGSVIGAEYVARSVADGYTLLVNANPHTSNPALVARLPFDTMRDFAAVTMLGSAPLLLTVHPSLPLRNVRELIAFAKARPNQLAYGSSGNGGPQHLAAELFKHMTGVGMLHVPYKGSTPVLVDLIGGQVQLSFAGMLAVLPHIKAGKLRPLAVSSARRSQANPEFPTLAESGVPGFEMMAWWGVFAPAGIPQAIVVKVQGDIARALGQRRFERASSPRWRRAGRQHAGGVHGIRAAGN